MKQSRLILSLALLALLAACGLKRNLTLPKDPAAAQQQETKKPATDVTQPVVAPAAPAPTDTAPTPDNR